MASPKRTPIPSAKPAPRTPRASTKPAEKPLPKAAARRVLKPGTPLRVLLAGGSGMIGAELQRQLTDAGHTVLKLVRRAPANDREYTWAPEAKVLDFRLLEQVDAVVNLSGAPLTHVPWTAAYKAEILRSRVRATEALAEAMGMAATAPAVFLSGSAVGFYGSRPGETITEATARGHGFLADVCVAWEAAAALTPNTTRTVLLRTGVVLGKGGALTPLTRTTRIGLGANLGGGEQVWPWVSLADEAGAIVHLLTSAIEGPVNLTAPERATADRITRVLAERLHRPRAFRIPQKVIELAAGDLGREMLLPDQHVVPERLLADGFVFRHPTLESAIDAALA